MPAGLAADALTLVALIADADLGSNCLDCGDNAVLGDGRRCSCPLAREDARDGM
jgi:hypothetical protein